MAEVREGFPEVREGFPEAGAAAGLGLVETLEMCFKERVSEG